MQVFWTNAVKSLEVGWVQLVMWNKSPESVDHRLSWSIFKVSF